jgi:hypothetical protein
MLMKAFSYTCHPTEIVQTFYTSGGSRENLERKPQRVPKLLEVSNSSVSIWTFGSEGIPTGNNVRDPL